MQNAIPCLLNVFKWNSIVIQDLRAVYIACVACAHTVGNFGVSAGHCNLSLSLSYSCPDKYHIILCTVYRTCVYHIADESNLLMSCFYLPALLYM